MKDNHVQQIGPSACGPTAILNVCYLLNYKYDKDKLSSEKFSGIFFINYSSKNQKLSN